MAEAREAVAVEDMDRVKRFLSNCWPDRIYAVSNSLAEIEGGMVSAVNTWEPIVEAINNVMERRKKALTRKQTAMLFAITLVIAEAYTFKVLHPKLLREEGQQPDKGAEA